jgi:hypothetical protein
MASILKVDTLTGVTTAGSISVTGEGNSTTTNLQQGLLKVWVNIDGTTTTEVRDSLNVSSVTDDGTGQTTITHSNDYNNSNYCATSAAYLSGTSTVEIATQVISTSQTKIITIQRNTGALSDHEQGHIHSSGDLA